MKLGVFTVLLGELPLEEALDKLVGLGVEAVEIGTGNYPGSSHCDPDRLLADHRAAAAFLDAIESRGLTLSALSQHGNPLHPDKDVARAAHETWRKTVVLAERLGVSDVIAFSGCPGDHEGARWPNWVTCAWPDDFTRVLEWQWSERVLPYWTAEAAFAQEHGVRIAFEPHPGFVVYNPETMLRLRDATGTNVGANVDPSHLFWQGIDPIEAIRVLGEAGALFDFHAKDTYVDPVSARVNGVLDAKPYSELARRSWSFRTVGYGHGEETWRGIVSALRLVGYDGAVSIEHEDALMSVDEGLTKAIAFLKPLLLSEPPAQPWWT